MTTRATPYTVTYTHVNGQWIGHAQGPDGDLPPYLTPSGRQFPGGYVTLTACMDGIRSVILDHFANRDR